MCAVTHRAKAYLLALLIKKSTDDVIGTKQSACEATLQYQYSNINFSPIYALSAESSINITCKKRALKMCLHITGDVPENILLTSADVAHLGRRREAHILNYMYKNKEKEELLDIKNVNTRSRVAPLFKTVIPSCEKYKNSALYHGAILWNMLPVNIRNIDSFDSFKAHQKKAMKENG